ncbi:rhomboid family intramembrane serine protease [Bacillaceae bacterium CLA-AA-H227]|uniref:Rhomboid family intramembrane serine protease n=1 Tax=Robertmurraya yapensis (ex Hitch et al 2024) TaxID=3133160 RepID=A0ACC6S7Y5_9BACI
MKVGEMLNTEDYVFWKLANFFISELDYRYITLSQDQKELWLEKRENKDAQVIRLLNHNIDWSNWLQKDIERTVLNGENIRKQMTRGELNLLNIYVTSNPPVDDYEFRINKPFVEPTRKKTIVTSMLIERAQTHEKIEHLAKFFGAYINFRDYEEVQEDVIESLKSDTLALAVNKVKKERALFDQGKPFFTYIFIAIQVVMFLLLELFGGSTTTSTLIQFGAKVNPLILEGEWWRFLTPIFLHIGFLHLVMNTIGLYYIGTTVERIFGRLRFLFIYLIAGFGGSVASFIFSPNLSAGASGAIFGCFGALLYFGLIYPKLFLRTMGLNLFMVLAINFAFGFTVSNVDNAGHIGGLIGGFLAAGIVHFPKKKKLLMQSGALIVTLLLSIGLLQYGFTHPTKVIGEVGVWETAQGYIEGEEYEKAYDLLAEFTQEEEASEEIYFLLSYTEIKLNHLDEAEKTLLKVLELDPKFHEAHYNLALVYLELQDYENAKLHAEKAVEIEPTNKNYVDLLNQF